MIVIVGGGTAGITVAARLVRAGKAGQVTLIEPSEKHYYQPLWTLVGGGITTVAESLRQEKDLIPHGVEWVKEKVASFQPEENQVTLASGKTLAYDYLIVAPGIQIDWNKVEGLVESIGKDGVCSNYDQRFVDSTWTSLQAVREGDVVFTMPSTPVKCGGAPQKIAYLAADYLKQHGLAGKTRVHFYSAGAKLFAVPEFEKVLSQTVARYGIQTHFRQDLVKVDAARKVAIFKNMDTGALTEQPYAMLHVTPPMSAPDFIKSSPLANQAGWIEADIKTLQHPRFLNVFALGDAAGLPTSKTGAAIRKQAPVLVSNLLAVMEKKAPTATYDGYTSCPVVTGYGRLVMAEFDYDNNVKQSFPFIDQKKERWDMYMVKRHLLPQMYWHGMLKGLL
ncbi:NAD(P)/FAD-dependent oxidoreductase [Armatimonas rosea]|uniref:Sulfide:quinone oxidoreductase n=1 Tax=Armatimonas rosea TaxID=685828 RepID=A0A7W9W8Y1_ARMRO|nr:FAD/NAD(P)-binding oxidoreductase [Armatimonas rosea]MBB6054034.1 sulfide:quinone oxidoreductase [Armatimonas rosea]